MILSYFQEKEELERLERERELKKEAIAEKEAIRVFAKESSNTLNPGLATVLWCAFNSEFPHQRCRCACFKLTSKLWKMAQYAEFSRCVCQFMMNLEFFCKFGCYCCIIQCSSFGCKWCVQGSMNRDFVFPYQVISHWWEQECWIGAVNIQQTSGWTELLGMGAKFDCNFLRQAQQTGLNPRTW